MYQASANFTNIDFKVTDFSTDSVLFKYQTDKKNSISLRNTPIYFYKERLSGTSKNDTLDSKQFIRKINGSNFALAVNRTKSGLAEVTLGAYKDVPLNSGAPMMGMTMGGGNVYTPMGTISIPSSMSFYGSYSLSGSLAHMMYYKFLLDNQLNHVQEEVGKEVQLELLKYQEATYYNSTAKGVSSFNQTLIYGYFDKYRKSYKWIKF